MLQSSFLVPRPGTQPVRLSQRELDGILAAVRRAGEATKTHWLRVILFGSRVDLSRRGGDIDLLIDVDPLAGRDSYAFKQRLLLSLEDELGEQKLDVLIDDGKSETSAFISLARSKGVDLWTND